MRMPRAGKPFYLIKGPSDNVNLLIKNLLPLTQPRFLVLAGSRRVETGFSRRVSLEGAFVVGWSRLEKTQKMTTEGVA